MSDAARKGNTLVTHAVRLSSLSVEVAIREYVKAPPSADVAFVWRYDNKLQEAFVEWQSIESQIRHD